MQLKPSKNLSPYLLIIFVINIFVVQTNFAQKKKIPSPKLKVVEKVEHEKDNRKFTTFRLTITNWEKFPAEMFEESPNLPPCGKNKNSSRTWVEIYSAKHKRLYGHCAIKSPMGLINQLSFTIPEGEKIPKKAYVIFNDRKLNKYYKSKSASVKKAKINKNIQK